MCGRRQGYAACRNEFLMTELQSIEWLGDLDDDCTAKWAGLTLRAERMNEDDWWWCVYDDQSGEQIASSNATWAVQCSTGAAARSAAESAARYVRPRSQS
jgi:hypothetical protein